MPILDRFRTARPDWEHADPQVRADAVRRLGRRERELLVSIARTDEEARVRRVAVHKLDEAEVLTEVARSDSDAGVRDEACDSLLRLACTGSEEAPAVRAFEALSEPRQILAAARDAKLEAVRRAALARIDDARSLGTLAKTSEHADTRLAALAALDDAELLLDVAQKSEHRDSALAALERLQDDVALEAVASHARHKAAARRARTRLDKLHPQAEAAPPASAPDTPEAEASVVEEDPPVAETPQTPTLVEPAVPPEDPGVVALRALCARAEALVATASDDEVAALEVEWKALAPASERPAATGLAARFEAALRQQRERAELRRQVEATRPAQEAACAALEALAAAAEHPSPEDWSAAEAAWKALEGPLDPELVRRVAQVARQRRESESQEAAQRRQRLIAVAERLEALSRAEALDLREIEAALREAREAVNDPGRLPSRRDREQLLERVRAARASIFPKAQALREEDEWTRWANVATLEEMCTRVEALAATQDLDLDALARELREIDARWKQAHPVPRDEGAVLWRRFRKAREPLRGRVGEHLVKRRAERQASMARRKDLVARAEALRESTAWVATAKELQALQAEWKTLPPVGRKQADALWKPFHEACQAFFARRKADQQSLRKEQAANLEKKQALVARAEALATSTDWEKAAAEVRSLQAEWKQVGPVRRSRADAVWQQFKVACDAFFERYRHKDEIVDEAAAAESTAACEALEALGPGEGAPAPDALAATLRAQLERWRDLPAIRGPRGQVLAERFRAARDRLLSAYPEAFENTELDPNASLPRREKLCERVEAHLPSKEPVDLATQLREALAANALGGAAVAQARAREAAADIRAARAAWERLGPAIGDAARALEIRFESACRRFHEAFPKASAPAPGTAPRPAGRPHPKGPRNRKRR